MQHSSQSAALRFVYRGATLTYRAAMAKVDFDRELAAQTERRRRRGIYLRLKYIASILKHEADVRQKRVEFATTGKAKKVTVSQLLIRQGENVIDEAWNNLDCIPEGTARALSKLKDAFYNLSLIALKNSDVVVDVVETPEKGDILGIARRTYKLIENACSTIMTEMETAVETTSSNFD